MAHRVVVVGGGFGGLRAAQGLRRAPVEVILIDRENFHLFQPLTYQVATGALSPSEIAYPLRAIFKRAGNVEVMLAEVNDVDLAARLVHLRSVGDVAAPATVSYDTLIVAAGSHYNYFGHDDWRELALEVKSLESALAVRARILRAFEAAEMATDEDHRAELLTFVVVGGGPTGVEMAGQIAELARDTLRRDFRSIDPRSARIVLIEALDRVLTSFPPSLSARAVRSLEHLGVSVMLGTRVQQIDGSSVTVSRSEGDGERIAAGTVIWAAGVSGEDLAAVLARRAGADLDGSGRVAVEGDLSLPGHPEVFALGDMVRVRAADGSLMALPGVAPVAIQQGRFVARAVRARLAGRAVKPFRYHDKGNLATIGRGAAVADIHRLRLSGFIAWATWLVVHLFYLVGFQNRIVVMVRWSASFATHGRGARLITRA
ncbi:MAG TPA: NAD(P)/FAD-dependent oxidoreductase [Solirubrobacteraceae bacterium]|nr:NAD(P)/FAD-dependent oxidoreductase [Solirubrobacteraceae bacterium]